MNWGIIITILLLLSIIVASDKFEFIKKKTQKYQKIKEIYITIVGVIILGIFLWVIVSYWDEIDFFQGRGGNPQEGYEDQY